MPEIKKLQERIRVLEKELRGERKRLDVVLQSIVDGVYTTDNRRNITFWNKGAERITGYQSQDVIGKPCSEILRHIDEKGHSLCASACPIAESMNIKDAIYGKDVYSGTASGRPVPVSVSCAPIFDPDGNVLGAIEVFRDISENKQLERQKADFYSMITHDLKSPLTVILGYAELLAEAKDLGEDHREKLDLIIQNGDRLNSLIMDFLTLSKMESSPASPVIMHNRLDDLLEVLTADFSSVAAQKGVGLSLSCPSPIDVDFDGKMMERAISNLISNAIKFTPSGGTVGISARVSGGEAVIEVADTGPGIPDDEKDRVFDMYFRSKTSSGVEGTGLGLAITKAFIEEHGGIISVRDGNPGGSVFRIALPVKSHLRQDK